MLIICAAFLLSLAFPCLPTFFSEANERHEVNQSPIIHEYLAVVILSCNSSIVRWEDISHCSVSLKPNNHSAPSLNKSNLLAFPISESCPCLLGFLGWRVAACAEVKRWEEGKSWVGGVEWRGVVM